MAKNKKPVRSKVESSFSKNLKSILEERGISQKAAAEMAQISAATLNGWLSSSSPSDHLAVQRLCKALGCSFEWLLTGQQTQIEMKNISLAELFEIEEDSMFSGIFEISAKRLKRKK